MTWNLVATGSASNDDEERSLVERLKEVLSEHHFGTLASGFNGETHRGPVHDAPEAEPEAAPEEAPSPDGAPAE